MNKNFKSIIASKEDIHNKCVEIAALIDAKHTDKDVVLVGLLKGAYVFTSDLAREIKNENLFVEFMVAKSYSNGESTGTVKVVLDLKKDIKGKTVIIVEDIVDTGRTLSKIKELLLFKGAAEVEIASLFSKPIKRIEQVHIDYPFIEVGDDIIVGYGLDYNEYFRTLPYVAALSEHGIAKYKK